MVRSTDAAANPSARGQRAAILASSLHELTGFHLAVDCLAPRCNGERVEAAWLVTGPILNARVRPRRVPLWGPEAREWWPLIVASEAVSIVRS
jgi:hypothetical protein